MLLEINFTEEQLEYLLLCGAIDEVRTTKKVDRNGHLSIISQAFRSDQLIFNSINTCGIVISVH